jgi:hypothetical protein
LSNIIDRIYRKLTRPFAEARYYSNFFSDLRHPAPTKGRILLYVGIGHMYLTPLEVLLYHLLRDEGYEVDYYVYDETVTANEVVTKSVVETMGRKRFWKNSVRNARRTLDAAGVTYNTITLSDEALRLLAPVKGDLDAMLRFTHEGVDLGDITRGVLYRYYKSLTFGADVKEVAFEFLHTALTNYLQVQKLQVERGYTTVFFSHGIYCTWQPMVEFCRRNGIRFVCYDRAKRMGSANFNINQPSPDWSFPGAWSRFADRSLTKAEEEMVSAYLGERELQKGDVYSYNAAARAGDIQALRASLGIPEGRKIVTIFTNLIWDAANVSRDIAFPSALDCILATIRHYGGDGRVQVVVRSHPAEKVLGTRERYGNLVRAAFPEGLPEHVTIIEPEQDVNSFSVIDMSDIGVVNTSTVGLEFAMMGKPIILISETNYRGKGFTFDAGSREEYFSMVDGLVQEHRLLPDQVRLARKYFYMMMFLYQKQMPTNYRNNAFESYAYPTYRSIGPDEPIRTLIRAAMDPSKTDLVTWE